MDLGHRVRDLRNARRLSQIELAAQAGVARNTLNRIENGHLMPTAPVIEHLAEALNVAPGALFEEPVPLDKAPHETGRPKMTAERALEIADSDSFRREAKAAPTEELKQTALELARVTEPQKREDLVRNKDHKEAHRRVIAQERISIINVQLDSRGTLSPVELVPRRFNDAMTPPEETPRLAREEQEGKEVG